MPHGTAGSDPSGKMSSKAAEEKAAEAEAELRPPSHPPVAEIRHVPRDPRTKARFNIFSRLLFLYVDAGAGLWFVVFTHP